MNSIISQKYLLNSIILFVFSLISVASLAQNTGVVRGFVYDKTDGEPVMFTNVKLKGQESDLQQM